MAGRDYDVVLYGAGGFTGRQTVEYFAKHAPPGLRWAIAGRNRSKLESIRSQIGAPPRLDDILIADSGDQSAVDAVVARTRILSSTAGPFALYGTPVVDACVRFGTHYVDITGETAWVHELTARYHDRAAAGATRVIPCCGFDSVPSDLGAWLIVRQLRDTLGVPCAEARGYFQVAGGLNGGTVASLLNMIDAGQVPRGRRPTNGTTVRYDDRIGAWTGPFVMAPTNTSVVRRSAELFAEWGEPYGRDFSYHEVLKYDPPFARAKAHAVAIGFGAFFAALLHPVTRRAVEPLLPKPGSGPSTRTMDEGWFTCELIGIGEDGRQVRGIIRHRGDPGNRATVRFLCESALCLALNADGLPGGTGRGGVLTPATGLGQALVDRLRAAGVAIEVPVS